MLLKATASESKAVPPDFLAYFSFFRILFQIVSEAYPNRKFSYSPNRLIEQTARRRTKQFDVVDVCSSEFQTQARAAYQTLNTIGKETLKSNAKIGGVDASFW
ncbi:unnamed protein product [Caenorhabditis sp. 36 PRJEB53466]|nr:unnamed protein product [Caenorhabditis sp. 36 PRJEB53466]